MRIARFSTAGDVGFGLVDGLDEAGRPGPDTVIAAIAGHPFAPPEPTGVVHRLADVRLLAPVLPSKIVAVGRNYAEHAAELGNAQPAEPMLFLKPNTSVIGPADVIRLPWQSAQVDHEAELAVVIGRLCRDVPVERVDQVVLGYTAANDVTARDLQQRDGQWGRAKGFDTFCPLGPWVSTDADPADLAVSCTVNGEVRQLGRTSQLSYGVAELVAYISAVMTLLPGDVILTGTPAGVAALSPGDEVSVAIEDVGVLTNLVGDRD
ncbi:MAG: FAA hydrolase family protein [Actinomycetota bacterium]|nr:MAG: FAA hydrolase family protein [Actinomycetota bacterium]